jgi:hypothetical protein
LAIKIGRAKKVLKKLLSSLNGGDNESESEGKSMAEDMLLVMYRGEPFAVYNMSAKPLVDGIASILQEADEAFDPEALQVLTVPQDPFVEELGTPGKRPWLVRVEQGKATRIDTKFSADAVFEYLKGGERYAKGVNARGDYVIGLAFSETADEARVEMETTYTEAYPERTTR